MGPDPFYCNIRAIDSILLVHVNMKIFQTRVSPDQNASDSGIVLKEEKLFLKKVKLIRIKSQ